MQFSDAEYLSGLKYDDDPTSPHMDLSVEFSRDANPLLDTFNLMHMLIRSQTFISIIFFMMAFQTRK